MLFLVATPLGNLGDITLRSLEILKSVDAIVCEDTRRTLKLLSQFGIRRPLLSMPAFDEGQRIAALIARLQGGERLALVSDAGSVAISDPGEKLVVAAIAAGIAVEALPGPSAVIAALQLSGLPTGRFTFVGFLPRKGEERRVALAELAAITHTLIVYESPRRLKETLDDLVAALGNRRASVARELTKLHEEIARGSLSELASHFSGEVLGEVTLVIAGAPRGERLVVTEADLDAAIDRRAGEGLGTRALAKAVAEELGMSVREVYQRVLMKQG
jgi:16S rRNA (cytidine1402-2'-O)-methyltransferase